MHVRLWALGGMAVLGLLAVAGSVQAQEQAPLDAHLSTSIDFPNALTFELQGTAPVTIDRAEVRYRLVQLSCAAGTSSGRASFAPTDDLDLSWTWDLRDAGGIPVGARVSYQWVLSGDGRTYETAEQTVVFEDPRHEWRTLDGEHMRLHWYAGSDSFARDLLNVGDEGLRKLQQSTGVLPAEPVEVRIYETPEAMRETVLFGQEWAGGVAYPTYGLVAMGINESNLGWGRDAMVHEMAHVAIGQATFRCGSSLPSWLDEGLAVYNEGPTMPAEFQFALDRAIDANAVTSLQSIAGAFPVDRDKAVLAYGQSRSVAAYLIEEHGPGRMNDLLTAFKRLGTIDRALTEVYGFDTDGLDAVWRTHVGLPPRATSGTLEPEPLPSIPPLGIPTRAPDGGTPLPTETPISTPTSPPTPTPTATPVPASVGGAGCNRSGASAGIDGGIMLAFALGGIVAARRRS